MGRRHSRRTAERKSPGHDEKALPASQPREHRQPKNTRIQGFTMQSARSVRTCVVVCTLIAAVGIVAKALAQGNGPNMFGFANPTGMHRTYNVNGAIDFDSLFFQSLGTHERSCASCHQTAEGRSIAASHVQASL